MLYIVKSHNPHGSTLHEVKKKEEVKVESQPYQKAKCLRTHTLLLCYSSLLILMGPVINTSNIGC